jgi:hypothetical protein
MADFLFGDVQGLMRFANARLRAPLQYRIPW